MLTLRVCPATLALDERKRWLFTSDRTAHARLWAEICGLSAMFCNRKLGIMEHIGASAMIMINHGGLDDV
jgi:hypothetical protein